MTEAPSVVVIAPERRECEHINLVVSQNIARLRRQILADFCRRARLPRLVGCRKSGRPSQYHTDLAPEDLNYPDTLRITISSVDDAFDEALDAASTAEAGEQTDAVVAFENAEGIRRLLTDRRLELLRSLMGEAAPSITELSDRLDRSYSVVHDDVKILAEYGIVKFRQEGQSKQPFVPYETIEFDVTVRAPVASRDTEASA